jgi:hypothetical protein
MALVKPTDAGRHIINVVLSDNHGASKTYKFTLTIDAPRPISTFTGVVIPDPVEETIKCRESNLKMRISEVDKQGNVYLMFSELMFDESVGFELERINEYSLEVKVVQGNTGQKLNMTWKPVSFELETLRINLNFSNPLEIA